MDIPTDDRVTARVWKPKFTLLDEPEPNGYLPPDEPTSTEGSQPTPFTLPIFRASELAGMPVPARLWHVRDIIPGSTVSLLGGDGGTGKSLLAGQLGVATALGSDWLGQSVKQGPCLFVTAEDDRDEMHRRLDDICRETNEDFGRLDDLHVVSLAGSDSVLALPDGKTAVLCTTPVFHAIDAAISQIKPILVVLDPLADLFGGEENHRVQARQFIGLLRGLAIRNECAVLLLAHPSLSGMSSGSGTSGSTGWSNSVRSRLYLDRLKDEDGVETDPDARVLRLMKANYSRIGAEIKMRWQRGVFASTEPPPTSAKNGGYLATAARDRADTIFLEMVAIYEADKRTVSTAGPLFAPGIFVKDPRAQGQTKRSLHDAMNRLFAAGKIRIHEFGPPSKQRRRIVIVRSEDEK